jgi:hypothetical protein
MNESDPSKENRILENQTGSKNEAYWDQLPHEWKSHAIHDKAFSQSKSPIWFCNLKTRITEKPNILDEKQIRQLGKIFHSIIFMHWIS